MARFAFLTTEFPSEVETAGGLAAYLGRITRLLVDAGHDAEVFTLSATTETFQRNGVTVHRVQPKASLPASLVELGKYLPPWIGTRRSAARLRAAHALAEAFAARARAAPFVGVQSANFNLCGYFVAPPPGCIHVVRCSQFTRHYAREDRSRTLVDDRVTEQLELSYLRKVDAVYAPSLRTCEGYRAIGIAASCVRPPIPSPVDEIAPSGVSLPDRFFVHFGKFSRLKGTDLVAGALDRVWREARDVKLVLAGGGIPRYFEGLTRASDSRVTWLGPLAKPQLNYVVRRAIATLAPSRVDNLPNTVIESLALGTRVIGSRGASIDELVEDGRSGELVEVGDERSLARAILGAHRGEGAWSRPFVPPAVLEEMQPGVALTNLLRLFGV